MIFGVDLSNYQAGIDIPRIRREGFEFAICKITQGVAYRSPAWPAQRDAARAAGLILAGYHYVDTSSPAGQAANCRKHIGDPIIPVVLDVEAGSGTVAHWRAVLSAFRAAGLRVVLSYIPRWYWQQVGSPTLAGFPPLWSSRYPSTRVATASELFEAVTSKHWAGYGGLDVAILQFASTALVAGRQIDANAYPGTRRDLTFLLGGDGGSEPTQGDAFMALTDGEQREILECARLIGRMKPGVELDARSPHSRQPFDDHFGFAMSGEANAADALFEIRQFRREAMDALRGLALGTGVAGLSEDMLRAIATAVNDEFARRQAN